MTGIQVGDRIATRKLLTIDNRKILLPSPNQLTHLQFRRYAGCPICGLHLRNLAAYADDISAAGVQQILVFYSNPDLIQEFHGDKPFNLIADPGRRLYAEFGVGTAARAVLDPRVWPTAIKATREVRKGNPQIGESMFGLPADFLISPMGIVLACKYGRNANDQWSAEDLLAQLQSTQSSLVTI